MVTTGVVRGIARGYFLYVAGDIPERKDPREFLWRVERQPGPGRCGADRAGKAQPAEVARVDEVGLDQAVAEQGAQVCAAEAA